MPNPWSTLLRIVRKVLASLDYEVGAYCWYKFPANLYFSFYPLDLMPRLNDYAALGSQVHGAEVLAWKCRGSTIAAYGGGSGLYLPSWSLGTSVKILSTGHGKAAIARAARRVVEHIDHGALAAHGPHPDIRKADLLKWIDNILVLLDKDPTARPQFGVDETLVPLAFMVAEVSGEETPWDEVWWPGHCEKSFYW